MSNDKTKVTSIIEGYFIGLHEGDVSRLKDLFHKDCVLKAPKLRRSLNEWLEDIATRPIPKDIGHAFEYKILKIDLEGDQAMVKLVCPLPQHRYLDYLGLLKENGVWKIVNKMYSIEPANLGA